MNSNNKIEFGENSHKRYRQGYFHPRNSEKYLGDINNIQYRSSWELHAFKFLDNNINVIRWGSEIIPIAYGKPVHPSENPRGWRPATYFPDLYVEFKHKSGKILRELIEIKPLKQTEASKARKASTKLQENITYVINQCKWEAAKEWCQRNNVTFRLCTENSIFKM